MCSRRLPFEGAEIRDFTVYTKKAFLFRVLDLKDVLKELNQTTKRRTEPLEYFVVSFLTLLLFFFPLTL